MTLPLRESFLQAMSRAAATVNIVTTDGAAGRAGVTVSAMTSVSADGAAPTLLVCIHHLAPAAAAVIANGCFCVNLLREDQHDISDVFAGRRPAPAGNRFNAGCWTDTALGAPRLTEALTAFACRVKSAERIDTHHIFIGEVAEVHLASGRPLIYTARRYGAAATLSPVPETKPAPVDRLDIGASSAVAPAILAPILAAFEQIEAAPQVALRQGDHAQILAALRIGAIDLAVLLGGALGPDIVATPLAELRPHALLAPNDPLAAQDQILPADLLTRRLISIEASDRRADISTLFDGIGTPRIDHRVANEETARALVAAGLGYALIYAPKGAAADGRVAPALCRPVTTSAPARDPARYLVLARRVGPLAPLAAAFDARCRAYFAARPDRL